MVSWLANQATAEGFRNYLSQDQAAEWSHLQDDLADHYAQQALPYNPYNPFPSYNPFIG